MTDRDEKRSNRLELAFLATCGSAIVLSVVYVQLVRHGLASDSTLATAIIVVFAALLVSSIVPLSMLVVRGLRYEIRMHKRVKQHREVCDDR